MALDYGVGRIVVDNITELHLLSEIAASMEKNSGYIP